MRSAIKWILLALVIVLIVTVGVVVVALYPQLSNMKNEYVTAGVIGDLDAYVRSRPGEWPKSWRVLGDGSDWSAYTKFRFDLSADSIIRQPELIYDAVTPLSGRYYTYPHAKARLDEVLKKLKQNRPIPTHNPDVDTNCR